ncbi:EthD family reductase [Mycobacterium vicinigordonae]|uniref:EthD family reductase n=1 Tax=Mycobacterium vicinigordonae TaxID=1719132 RepID=A0A7D6I7H6_9MYCO|nr:EthD family reductase [Mycobacterium vicinigordonae]QLL06517.1 EthD family reductase [Mycobacterium vicinigordonae]
MYEVFIVLREKPGKSSEDSIAHWAGPHAEFGKKLPGIRKYTQYRSIGEPGGGANTYLGIAALTFDSEQAFLEMTQSPEFAETLEDTKQWADVDQLAMFAVDTARYV